jgi:pyridoxal phosphate enzyme (YggS family)
LIQVNIDQEDSKSGIPADQATALVAQCQQLKRVKVRGLMVIPRPRASFAAQCEIFAQTRLLLESINDQLSTQLNQLSMGMSSDIEAAIKEGSTMLRIGTALFGERPY